MSTQSVGCHVGNANAGCEYSVCQLCYMCAYYGKKDTVLCRYISISFLPPSKNQLVDSMKLFDFICNNRWFRDVPIVLLLNNTDLLAERLVGSPLTICFPEYNGMCCAVV